MKLNELLDMELLQKHLLNGVVSDMKHPQYPNLKIYNYSHVAQHDNIWDNVTEQCRGLIVDTNTGDVLARPFRKFFNLNTSFRPETQEANLPVWTPRVLEKLDGSLGILYYVHGIPSIATRGSFASDQAKWATEWYHNNTMTQEKSEPYGIYSTTKWGVWPEGYTPLFEIIYKENRIVVSYEFEGLVLLGLVNIDTGFELSPEEVATWAGRNGLRVAQEFSKTLGECKSEATSNTEGFVLQYWCNKAPVPLRIKVKTEEYVRLHKVITGLNPKGIWEHLSLGYDPQALWMPAVHNKQFTDWCIGWINTFQRMYEKLEKDGIAAFGRASIAARATIKHQEETQNTEEHAKNTMDSRYIRKCYAVAIQKEASELYSALFAMYDGRDYNEHLWKLIEPKIQGKEVSIRNGDTNNGI